MMMSYQILACMCLVVATVQSLPVDQSQKDNDLFSGFLRSLQLDEPSKQSEIVKRRVLEDQPEREIKQISLQSLIGDLEDSLFASALSVHDIVHDKTAVVPEIKPTKDEGPKDQHEVTKRDLIGSTSSTTEAIHEFAVTEAPIAGKSTDDHVVILQTTEKVPEASGVPAHIIIDRIAIQPHSSGSVPLIPAFEIKRTQNGNAEKSGEITKITISKTEISSVPNTPEPATSSTDEATTVAVSTTPSSTTEKPTTTAGHSSPVTETTTIKNIDQLKEAEQELQEKVAEIEAEPVILSARV
ncbi:uncharacterized protein LOC142234727 [Haematobia irritans]|uniref:uncharacterized protein LOC142234727 n=1 Tax=Haematobia irritans TaxID=7368 RepID=UPI003F500B2C